MGSAFNVKWNTLLEAKKSTEVEAEAKAKVAASGELSNWNSQREIRLASKKDSNRYQRSSSEQWGLLVYCQIVALSASF